MDVQQFIKKEPEETDQAIQDWQLDTTAQEQLDSKVSINEACGKQLGENFVNLAHADNNVKIKTEITIEWNGIEQNSSINNSKEECTKLCNIKKEQNVPVQKTISHRNKSIEHTNKKPYSCNECGKSYSRFSSLK
ncbi:unnamed protein product, partial [Leptidea sinapis]